MTEERLTEISHRSKLWLTAAEGRELIAEVRRLRAENSDLWERANRYATIAGDWRNLAVGSSKERPTAPMPVKHERVKEQA